ncbi:molybdopterin molybdotransferase MoeA [Hyphobacterium sp.]|uniref:molybdopterin molybdotransferase MoeA n=1 Tax=Hyphobacterium sp. TaxID=2004662 RepID=UPI003BAA6806
MISLDEARALIAQNIKPLGSETVDLTYAAGRILAKDISAQRTQPPQALSAMDGYAVRSEDVGIAPFIVIGESAAGHPFQESVGAGEAVRISTGAAVPGGADQVVIQENAERDGDHVALNAGKSPGQHIRAAGLDFAAGHVIAFGGDRLTSDRLVLVAAAGHSKIEVYRNPRVAFFCSGDELAEPGEDAQDKIINSLAPGLSAWLREEGAAPTYLGIAGDAREAVAEKFAVAAGHDLVIAVGGASVGDHDHVKAAFAEGGGELIFEKIAVKPGKPTWFGLAKGVPHVGLPGNPVSALVMTRLVVDAALAAMTGQNPELRFDQLYRGEDLPANGPRETFLRGLKKAGRVSAMGNQDSSALTPLAAADVLIHRPAHAPAVVAANWVNVLPLGER